MLKSFSFFFWCIILQYSGDLNNRLVRYSNGQKPPFRLPSEYQTDIEMKTHIYLLKQEKSCFWNKTFDQCFGAKLKKHFFAEFCGKFVTFCIFWLFSTKKHWKWLFQPALGCAAPKSWSKSITHVLIYWFFFVSDIRLLLSPSRSKILLKQDQF